MGDAPHRDHIRALVFAAGFYLLLIDTVDLPELYAGCGVAVLAAVMFDVSRRQGLAEAAFAPRWFGGVRRVAMRLTTQIAVVCWEAPGSLTPNTIVIGIEPERKLLLVHQLHRQGGREALDVMRLG